MIISLCSRFSEIFYLNRDKVTFKNKIKYLINTRDAKTIYNKSYRLKNGRMKLQPDKCEFFRKEGAYIGYLVTKDGVKSNPEK